jgi:hypothetical protein
MKTNKVTFYFNSTAFFLKNIWFSPSVNFLYVLFGIVLIILKVGQDLKLNDILLSMFLLGLTAFCTGNIVFDKQRNVLPWFKLLPLSTKKLLRVLTLSGFLYSLLIQSILTIFIGASSGIPFIGNPHVTTIQTPSGEVVSLAEGFIVDVDGRTEIPYQKMMRPSLIFGIVTTPQGYTVFPFWRFLFIAFFTAITFYFIVHHHISHTTNKKTLLSHWIISGVYTCLGAVSLFDSLLPSKTVWLWRSHVERAIWIIPILITIFTIVLIIRTYCELSRLELLQEVQK